MKVETVAVSDWIIQPNNHIVKSINWLINLVAELNQEPPNGFQGVDELDFVFH